MENLGFICEPKGVLRQQRRNSTNRTTEQVPFPTVLTSPHVEVSTNESHSLTSGSSPTAIMTQSPPAFSQQVEKLHEYLPLASLGAGFSDAGC